MPTWTADEKTAIFNANDGFSDAAYYDGGVAAIYGWFTNDYTTISLVAGDVASAEALFTCAASSVTGVVQGKALVQGGVNYTVVIPKPDGAGLTTLVLKKA